MTPGRTVSTTAGRAAPLLHVGYHKTGTTWLQSGLFRDDDAGFASPWGSTEIRRVLVQPTAFTFDPAAASEVFRPGAEAARARGLVPVLSDERLSGSPHSGGHDTALLADRLAATFPEGRVLLVIREQKRVILSVYKQYVRDGGGATLDRYLFPRNPDERPQFRFEHYEYHHLVAHYRRLFGVERVLVLTQEQLAAGELDFCRRVARFAGLPEPVSAPRGERYPALSAFALVLKRPFNRRFVRNSLSPAAPRYVKDHERRFERLDRWLPALLSRPLERRWRREVEIAVNDRYAASNRRTAELTGLDLAGLGYPVEAS